MTGFAVGIRSCWNLGALYPAETCEPSRDIPQDEDSPVTAEAQQAPREGQVGRVIQRAILCSTRFHCDGVSLQLIRFSR